MAQEPIKINTTQSDLHSLTFKEELLSLRKFLAERELLGEVANRAGCKGRTVQYALSAETPEQLIRKKYLAYNAAINLKKEIEELYAKYTCLEQTDNNK